VIALYSCYGDNIHPTIPRFQSEVIRKFLPAGACLVQAKMFTDHGGMIDAFLQETDFSTYIILDIDCIPLCKEALDYFIQTATNRKCLVGCAQRANHISNGEHLYAGAFAHAFPRTLWVQAGKPSFRPTNRGDVAEELSWKSEEQGIPTSLLYPTHVIESRWPLQNNQMFGIGTTYGTPQIPNMFFHTFEIRTQKNIEMFQQKCIQVIQNRV
jgi:hypothetical protein